MTNDSAIPAGHLLFVDKVLASRRQRPPRGVELFNLNLLRDLSHLHYRVTALVHPSWQASLQTAGPTDALTITSPSSDTHSALSTTWIRNAVRRHNADILLLGNIANRLIPALLLMRFHRVARHCVLVVHREPSRRSLLAQKTWPSTIVAVNQTIAAHFVRHGFRDVHVDYGITNADRFYPVTTPNQTGIVDFCVAGNLDNPWKGSDTAIAAFRRLPPDIRKRSRLHLASFHRQPDLKDDQIIPYAWMPADAMPDFFRRMDVMVVPSRDEGVMRETFSQVMVQGMLCGLPIIANRLPILTEKLDLGGGIAVDSPERMADAMQWMVTHPADRLAMGKAARQTALDRYVWDTRRFAHRYLEKHGVRPAP